MLLSNTYKIITHADEEPGRKNERERDERKSK